MASMFDFLEQEADERGSAAVVDLLIEQQELLKRLQRILPVVASGGAGTINEVNTCVLFDVDAEGRIEIKGTNQKHFGTTLVQADVRSPGTVAIPAQVLKDTVQFMRGRVRISLIESGGEEGAGIYVDDGNKRAHIPARDPDDFPTVAFDKEGMDKFEITGAALRMIKDGVAFAVSTAITQPTLQYVHLRRVQAKDVWYLICSAIDGFRGQLARVECNVSECPALDGDGILIQPDLFGIVATDMADTDKVDVYLNEQRVIVRNDKAQVEFGSVLGSGKFPPLLDHIPRQVVSKLVLNKEQLGEALDFLAVILRQQKEGGGFSHSVLFEIDRDKQLVTVRTNGGVGAAKQPLKLVSATYHDEHNTGHPDDALRIAVKLSLLRDALEPVTGDHVLLEMITHRAPLVVKSVKSADVVGIIMPLTRNEASR